LLLGLAFLGREGLTMGKVAKMTEEPPGDRGASPYVATMRTRA
jgi:hypothetical protein